MLPQATIYNRLITETSKVRPEGTWRNIQHWGPGFAVCPSSQDRAKQETGWVLAGSLHGD